MASSRIEFLLAEVKRQVRRNEVVASLVLLAVLAIAFFTIESVVDRVLLLDRWVRAALFSAFAVFSLVYLVVPLYLGLKRIRSLYAARIVEERHPELRESLSTLLQAEKGEAVGAKALIAPLRQRVERWVMPLDPEKQADRSLLRWTVVALALAAVFAGGGVAAGGSGFFRCLARCVNPFRELLPPTRTVIARITPGDARVLRSKPVPIVVETEGEAVSEARLYFTEDGAQWLVMALAGAGAGRFAGMIPSVKEETRYFVLTGDTRSETYTLTPQDPPDVAEIRATLKYPEYSGLGERETKGGDIDALCGTRAVVRVTGSGPLTEAFLRMEDGQLLPMTVEGTTARVQILVQKNTTYSVRLVAPNGTRNEDPPVYAIVARKDQPPVVRVSRPGRDVEVPADETLALGISATDDCGVEQLALVYQVKGGRSGRKPIRLGQERRNVVLETGLLPATMGLKAGDVMLYYVEAVDGLQPKANRAVSPLYLITVRQPAGAQAQKPDAKKAGDKDEFKDRLTQDEEAKLAKVERMLKQLKKADAGKKKDGDAEKGDEADARKTDTLPRRGEMDEDPKDADAGGEKDAAEEDPYAELPAEITDNMVTAERRGHDKSDGT